MEKNEKPTELETFLPQNGSKMEYGLPLEHKVKSVHGDAESALKDEKKFDPFEERQVANPTTDCDTLTHLLKASLGTGILAMPLAFKHAGLVMGIFATLLVGFICTHCSYILVKCSHILYYKTLRTQMSYAEVAQVSFASGPKWARPFAIPSKHLIQIGLFLTYYAACSVYCVIVAANFKQVLEHHLGYEVNIRLILLALLVPVILISWVPDLKYLAPVSMIANIFMSSGLGITIYYLVKDLKPSDMEDLPMMGPISEFPSFFSITVFAIEAIGVVMPLENQMKTPKNFIGLCGVMNKGMSVVTIVYVLLGFLGYAKYGEDTSDSITLNLPLAEIPAQVVKILIGLAVFCSFGLQFYVCLDIVWTGIKHRYEKKPLFANYVTRTLLCSGAVLIAIAVPTIGPFVGLIGALFFSICGLLAPLLIETVTYWDIGFGKFHWIAVKNVIIAAIGVLVLVFGTSNAIKGILSLSATE